MEIRRTGPAMLITLAALLIGGCTEISEDVKVHPSGWAEPGGNFHGDKISASGLPTCASCHNTPDSEAFAGGSSGIACSDCHEGGGASPHPYLPDFIRPTHENYHGRILWENGFDFFACQKCHGVDLAGGVVEHSCSNTACHKQADGVYTCDNCHAWETSRFFIDVRNITAVDSITVGVHTSHYTAAHGMTNNVTCASCHIVPETYDAVTHIDGAPHAEVTSGALITADSTFTFDFTWDRATATCSEVYCHGSFDYNGITGKDSTWTWTEPVAGTLCGTCHALPPPGHYDLPCANCHASVVDQNNNIIDPDKHIDGRRNVFGN